MFPKEEFVAEEQQQDRDLTESQVAKFAEAMSDPSTPSKSQQPSPEVEDTSWWEDPLDQVIGRKVDGKTTYHDATEMDLGEIERIARGR